MSKDWIREREGEKLDGRIYLCAFWGEMGIGYNYALGTWSKEYSGFTFSPDTIQGGQLMYWAFIETPPMPRHTVDEQVQAEQSRIEGWLEHIDCRLGEIVGLLEEQK